MENEINQLEEVISDIASEKVQKNPGLYYEQDDLIELIQEDDRFFDLVVKFSEKFAEQHVKSDAMQMELDDLMQEISDQREYERDPHRYYGVSEQNIAGVL